jgi:hypothetical protein
MNVFKSSVNLGELFFEFEHQTSAHATNGVEREIITVSETYLNFTSIIGVDNFEILN